MREERRSHRRAQVPGMRVAYEDASGQRIEAEALDVGAGGVFVRTDSPAGVGKRLSLELSLAGQSTAWSALGRVVWTRPESGDSGPSGMGVKLIDADESVIAAIERLVALRERTAPGTGGAKTPAREPTVLGIGTSDHAPVAATPIVAAAPARERTVLGVGATGSPIARPPPRPSVPEPPPEEGWEAPAAAEEPTKAVERSAPEPSIAIDLLAKKPDVDPAPPTEGSGEVVARQATDAPSEASLARAGLPRRRGRGWVAIVVVLAIGGVGYAMRDRLPWLRAQLVQQIDPVTPPAPEPPPPASAVLGPGSASAAAAVPPVLASGSIRMPAPNSAPSASTAIRPGASASTKPASVATARPAPASSPQKRSTDKSGDNPY